MSASASRIVTLPKASRAPRPDAYVLALEEVKTPGLERVVVLGTGILLAGFLGWAAATRVPELAIGTGEVVPALAAAPVQHLEGGIVDAVLVGEGDLVEEGQPLLRMNDAAARAELGQLRIRNASLRLQASRLAAFVKGGLDAMPPLEAGTMAAPQRDALVSRLQALADRQAVLSAQAAQRQSELATLAGQVGALERQIIMQGAELELRESLAQNGLATRVVIFEARRLLMTTQAERERLVGQVATVRRALSEAEARLEETRSTAIDEARQDAARVALEIAETDEMIGRLEDRAGRTLVRAPSPGVVRGLAVQRPGTVVQAGALMAEIMPQHAPLVADIRLLPRDIGFIRPGQAVDVKVQAFDYARFGTLQGEVDRISAGTFLDEHRQPYYRARITLAQPHIGQDPEKARLVPGMTVQADIRTGEKTVLQYLLKPIYAAMTGSFHER